MNVKIKTDIIAKYYPNLPYSPLLQTLLNNLGLNEDEVIRFLNSYQMDFEDPTKIFGMDKAVEVITEAIEKKQKVAIHGDFDVDGISATTILFDYLYYECGIEVLPIIPHRVDEGYGLSEKTIQKALAWGANLIITVDCGIKDVVLVDKYKDQVDFIITDHHQFYTNEKGEIELPKAKAVVHSAHPESEFSTMISGGATSWQLVRALQKNKEQSTKNESDDSLVNKYLDLVAMSTVCDIIPLTLENRKFIQRGCKQIAQSERIGLLELLKVSQIDPKKVDCFHFGFVLGPRLNAAARVTNDAMDALRLLSTRKKSQAEELAGKLDQLNVQRKSLTLEYLEQAEKQINPDKKAIVVLGHEWPEGILGLVAGRLAEKYYKPTFVASAGHDGNITGSSRSPLDAFYLNKALEHAQAHLSRFGGHKQAAGFASELKIFEGFEDKILEFVSQNSTDEDFVRTTDVDLVLESLEDISIPDIEEIALLEPHGVGNPRPMFLLKNCTLKNFSKLGKEQTHLKLFLKLGSSELEGIGFSMAEEYFPKLHSGQKIDVLGHLSINEWNNTKKIQIEVKNILIT
jgi:single-stranded-DNA-specific exonuclease